MFCVYYVVRRKLNKIDELVEREEVCSLGMYCIFDWVYMVVFGNI